MKIALFLALFAFFLPNNSKAKTCACKKDKLFKNNMKSVVIIYTKDKYGLPISKATGFVIKKNGLVATVWHAIKDKKVKSIFIRFERQKKQIKLKVNSFTAFPETDLVFLQVDHKFKNKIIPRFKKFKEYEAENVYTLGFPLSLSFGGNAVIKTKGHFVRYKRIGKKHQVFFLPTGYGGSGGPVFDANGKFVGMARAIFTFTNENAPSYPFTLAKEARIIYKKMPK